MDTSTAYCIYYSHQSVSVHADWLVISHAFNSNWLASFNMSMRPVTKIAIICETAKINCKKRYRLKKATLYERDVILTEFFIRWQKLPYSYNRWLGTRSLKATYSLIF
jgi:hypothetical protein